MPESAYGEKIGGGAGHLICLGSGGVQALAEHEMIPTMTRWSTTSQFVAVTSVLTSACSDRIVAGEQCEPAEVEGQGTPPVLTATAMVDDQTIRLTFTEPIAPVDCVDPEKFRISVATGYVPDANATYYSDPAAWGSICMPTSTPQMCCYDHCNAYGCMEQCTEGVLITRVIGVANNPDDDHSLLLELNQPIGDYACMFADMYIDYQEFMGGLFVHYRPGGIPQVQSTSGGDLEAIAEHWVLSGQPYAVVAGADFPQMDTPLPFTCP